MMLIIIQPYMRLDCPVPLAAGVYRDGTALDAMLGSARAEYLGFLLWGPKPLHQAADPPMVTLGKPLVGDPDGL